jgi:hypothetical protein
MKVFILSFEFCLNDQYLEKLKEEYHFKPYFRNYNILQHIIYI